MRPLRRLLVYGHAVAEARCLDGLGPIRTRADWVTIAAADRLCVSRCSDGLALGWVAFASADGACLARCLNVSFT